MTQYRVLASEGRQRYIYTKTHKNIKESFLILQDLLQAVTLNCTTHSAIDIEIISSLSKLRLKTKQNINLFLTCLRLENILGC
jgi:hypothetical protein